MPFFGLSHKEKQNVQRVEESTSEQSTPRAYPLNPVTSAPAETTVSQNTGDAPSTSEETEGEQLPVKSTVSYPMNPLAPPPAHPIGFQNPVSSPSAALECPPYSFNTPEPPSFVPSPNEPPPPYSLYPSQGQNLPSYTVNQFPRPTAPPVSESSSATPCPSNTSAIPYPYNI